MRAVCTACLNRQSCKMENTLELASYKNLNKAVNICYSEEYHKVIALLNSLRTSELVRRGLAMSGLGIFKEEVDKESGSRLLHLYPISKSKVFVPLFKRGDPVILRHRTDDDARKSIRGIVKESTRRGFVILLNSFDEITSEIVLTVAPDPLPFQAMLTALSLTEEVEKTYEYHHPRPEVEVNQQCQQDCSDDIDDLISSIARVNLSEDSQSVERENQRQKESEEREVDMTKMHTALKAIQGLQEPISLLSFPIDRCTALLEDAGIRMNDEQMDAVHIAANNQLTSVYGPPGTGKSTTIVGLLKVLLADNNERIIICGPSNVSVDSVLEKLEALKIYKQPEEVLRLGSRFRMSEKVHNKFSASCRISKNKEVRGIKKQISELADMCNLSSQKDPPSKLINLQERLQELEREILKAMIANCRVLACTLNGLHSVKGDISTFTTVIIDEISQCSLPLSYIPLAHAKGCRRIVMSGDSQQLPPTIIPNDSFTQDVLKVTLFDVMKARFGTTNRCVLKVQHRMNETIMEYPSRTMYNSELVAHESVAKASLSDNNWVLKHDLTNRHFVWFDTSSTKRKHKEEFHGFSRGNFTEADAVVKLVIRLTTLGVRNEDIGVISPYKFQTAIIAKQLGKDFSAVDVCSIDGFQGREKQVIIISMVRCGNVKALGFASNPKRMNVALTRAKQLLCIVGSTSTLKTNNTKDFFINGLIDMCKEKGYIQSL